MKKTALALAIVASACTSQPPMPETQRAYVETWRALKSEWKANSDNGIRRDATEEKARAFFKAPITVARWTGTVDSVKSGYSNKWIKADSGGMWLLLYPTDDAKEAIEPLLSQLNEGDRVVFDGVTVIEFSLSITGAILDPEIRVDVSRVEKI